MQASMVHQHGRSVSLEGVRAHDGEIVHCCLSAPIVLEECIIITLVQAKIVFVVLVHMYVCKYVRMYSTYVRTCM